MFNVASTETSKPTNGGGRLLTKLCLMVAILGGVVAVIMTSSRDWDGQSPLADVAPFPSGGDDSGAVNPAYAHTCSKSLSVVVPSDKTNVPVNRARLASTCEIGDYGNDGKPTVARMSKEDVTKNWGTMDEKLQQRLGQNSLSSSHKWMKLNGKLLLLYTDNTVVAADEATCQVTGLYLSQNKKLHPAVSNDVSNNMHVVVDKGQCRAVTCSLRLNGRNIGLCKYRVPGSCPNVNGWSDHRTTPRRCDTIVAPMCSEAQNFGQNCPITGNDCQSIQIGGIMRRTTSQLNGLVTAKNVASYVTGLHPTFGSLSDVAFGLIGIFLGGSPSTTDAEFRTLTNQINVAIGQLKSCVNARFVQTKSADAKRLIDGVRTRLDVPSLRTTPVDVQLRDRFRPNQIACTDIGSLFNVANPNQQFVEQLLPWALEGVDYCTLNYVGYVGALVQAKQTSSVAEADRLYRTTITRINDFVRKAIAFIETDYLRREVCGYFNQQAFMTRQRIQWLKDNFGTPISELAASANKRRA